MVIEIRKAQKTDEKELLNICFITGDPFLKKVFPKCHLFGLFWCIYYVRYETDNCFVAVDPEKKNIVGYILSTLDTIKQKKDFKIKFIKEINSQIKLLPRNKIRAKIVANFIINRRITKKKKEFLETYPAHLHIDILPDYQRKGLGHKLMDVLENHFKENKVKGYHLEVSSKNITGINFYKKYDLNFISKNRYTIMFTKKLNGN
ncbi:MAG: GNAT family N-acetyltransferase [Candidatus Heimdallarchaeota archaeon]|nr:GNAT family N-acetyltransferase [Candidatus Heimdallarchaeota archaeon]